MKDREVAKDVLQDGFVTLFEKISTYKSEGSFEGWARKIFVNTALMQLRRNDALKFSDNIEDSQVMQMTQSNTLEKIGADEIFKLVSSMPDGFQPVRDRGLFARRDSEDALDNGRRVTLAA